MTQQLEQSGVVPGLAVVLQDVIRLTTQQQQQQQNWRLYQRIIRVLSAVCTVWGLAAHACPAMLPTIIPAALPLLQQLQHSGQLLPTATTAPRAHSSSSSSTSSTSSRDTGSHMMPQQDFLQVQRSAGRFLAELVNGAQQITGGIDTHTPSFQLLRDPAVSELLLQLLAAHTVILHKDSVAHRQQQRQQQRNTAAGSSSSSSSSNQSQQRPAPGAKQQHRADLRSIPAFHQHPDMLQLLPGGQAYLDAAAALDEARDQQQTVTSTQLLSKSLQQVQALQESIIASLKCTLCAQHDGDAVDATAPVLSAAAVRLVLQLQLLAASLAQRRRAAKQQQQQQEVEVLEGVDALLVRNNHILHMHIRAVLQCTSSSSLQPEVLQQAGLQLLQALAAPLQQLQLCGPNDSLPRSVQRLDVENCIAEQLFALQAAAAGLFERMPSTTDDAAIEVPTGQLPNLAAAHPEAFAALTDCFLRAPVMHAVNMMAVGRMVRQAGTAVLDSDACMGNTVAVAGLASAITSLVKRAVQFVRDACGLEQQRHSGWQLDDDPLLLAAACYPAVVADLISNVLRAFNRGLCSAAVRINKPSTHNSSSSTSQAAAGAAMLAVVLARSLVQLADAMEAAGPQVLFSCQRLEPAFNLVWSPEGQEYAPQQVEIVAPGSAAHQNVGSQWQGWQLIVLAAMEPLMSAMATLGMADLAGDAIFGNNRAAAATAAAAAGPVVTASSSSSRQASNTSSSSRPKWGHLLHLRQFSPDWPGAVEAFWDRRPYWSEEVVGLLFASTPNILEEVQLQFDNALQLTRELVDAAPLPVVFNNPGCESLAGVSEAAASCKACSWCRCRYCSVACQRADWKRHKPVCKRMAATGMICA